jgi:large subunit ribosomal protein L32
MVVRMRHTRSHTANRRSHHALSAPKVTVDAKTGGTHLRHRIDMTTGMYKGRKVIDVVKKVAKKQSKAKGAK